MELDPAMLMSMAVSCVTGADDSRQSLTATEKRNAASFRLFAIAETR
jgi:hypothetical protein